MDAFLERVPAPEHIALPDYVGAYRWMEGWLDHLGEGVGQDDDESRDLLEFIYFRRAVNKCSSKLWTTIEKIQEQFLANHTRATEAGRAVQAEIVQTAYRDVATENALIRRVEETVADFQRYNNVLSTLLIDALTLLELTNADGDRLDAQEDAIVARQANRATRGG